MWLEFLKDCVGGKYIQKNNGQKISKFDENYKHNFKKLNELQAQKKNEENYRPEKKDTLHTEDKEISTIADFLLLETMNKKDNGATSLKYWEKKKPRILCSLKRITKL